MAAYVVFGLESVTDADALQRYRVAGQPTLAAHGARFVAGPRIAATLEGAPLQGAVVVAFDNAEAAQSWYHSPEYQAVLGVRLSASTGFAFIVEGRD